MHEPPQKSWWGRNWFWALPVGCLSSVLLCGGCVGALFLTVFSAIRGSEPYREALAAASTNPEVKAQFGEPIEAGFLASGNVQISGGSGSANIAIPFKGPKQSGTIYVEATRVAGKWEYSRIEVAPDGGGKRIDVRPKPAT